MTLKLPPQLHTHFYQKTLPQLNVTEKKELTTLTVLSVGITVIIQNGDSCHGNVTQIDIGIRRSRHHRNLERLAKFQNIVIDRHHIHTITSIGLECQDLIHWNIVYCGCVCCETLTMQVAIQCCESTYLMQ